MQRVHEKWKQLFMDFNIFTLKYVSVPCPLVLSQAEFSGKSATAEPHHRGLQIPTPASLEPPGGGVWS